LQAQLESEEMSEEERVTIEREIQELLINDVQEIPPMVDIEKRHHVVLFGPPGCGKSATARHLSKTHKRCIVNMNELLDWH